MKKLMMFAAAAMLTSAPVFAQVGPPATLAKVTVSDEVAKRTLNKYVINADTARAIVDETGLMKAKTALYARSSSAEVAQRFNNVDGRLIRLSLGEKEGLSYYFVGGGLPIVV